MHSENIQTQSRFKRFLRFPLTRIFVGVFWITMAVAATESLAKSLPASWLAYTSALLAVGALLGYYTFVRLVEQRQPNEILGRSAPLELLSGLVIGAGLISATVAVLYMVGAFTITGTNELSAMELPFMTAIMAGTIEELLVRGVFFRILEEWQGSAIAIAASAILFCVTHIPNPGSNLISVVAISLEAGVMLAAAFMLTRRLWLAIGIHIAWNFVQGGVFGIATSGVVTKGWLDSKLSGPDLLSGGDFGAEASIVAVVACLSAGIGMLWLAHKRKRWIPRGRHGAG
jgi:membrane protease YdiL (CAAX protease family)